MFLPMEEMIKRISGLVLLSTFFRGLVLSSLAVFIVGNIKPYAIVMRKMRAFRRNYYRPRSREKINLRNVNVTLQKTYGMEGESHQSYNACSVHKGYGMDSESLPFNKTYRIQKVSKAHPGAGQSANDLG